MNSKELVLRILRGSEKIVIRVNFCAHHYSIIPIVALTFLLLACAPREAGPPDAVTVPEGAAAPPYETISQGDRARSDHERPSPTEEAIGAVITGMSLEERVGQLFMPAFWNDSRGNPVTSVNEEVRNVLRTVQPGGVVFFGVNIREPEQVRSFVEDLQQLASHPLIVAVDQEGGVVDRLNSGDGMTASRFPSARRVGLTGDEDLAYEIGRITARELRSLGITMNFAPVADVLTNSDNPALRDRTFGDDPDHVARMVAATVRGLQDNGVAAVIKHFPGHGDTSYDSHYSAVTIPHSLDRLRSLEFIPFRAGFSAGAAGVMTAHISLPEIVGDLSPATLSPLLLRTVLREELEYSGLVVTDSLAMVGVASGTGSTGDRSGLSLAAFQAGADILLYPVDPVADYQRLLDAVRDGTVSEEALDRSVRRILRAKFELGLMVPPKSDALYEIPERFVPETLALGLPEHREVLSRVP